MLNILDRYAGIVQEDHLIRSRFIQTPRMPLLVGTLLLAGFLVSLPPRPVAGVTYAPHSSILIRNNSQFTGSNGVTGGSGSVSDPYIIQGWNISAPSSNAITIANTTARFIIRNVQVSSAIRGIFLTNVTGGTVQSSLVSQNKYGVDLEHSYQVTVSNNNFSRDQEGVFLVYSIQVTVSQNRISQSTGSGITTEASPNCLISGNNITGSRFYGIFSQYSSTNDEISGNRISSSTLDDILIAYTSNETVTGNTLTSQITANSLSHIFLDHADHITVSKNTATAGTVAGLSLLSSSYTSVSGNSFPRGGISFDYPRSLAKLHSNSIASDNTAGGKPIYWYKDCTGVNLDGVPVGQVFVVNCNGIRIANTFINGSDTAITVQQSQGLLISSTQLQNNGIALFVINSSYVSILKSTFSNNIEGLNLSNVTSTEILENTMSGNTYTIAPSYTDTILLHHNNFLDYNLHFSGTYATYDMGGYPSGGNYWAGYTGVDNCSGPLQNICPSPDGIGDTPAGGDPYPLMKPWSSSSDTTPPVWPAGSSFSSNASLTGVTLTWTPASDDLEVGVYRIQQGSTVITYLPRTVRIYTLSGLSSATRYTFTITPGDTAGNWGNNQTLTVSTLSPPSISIPPGLAWYLAVYAATLVAVGSGLAYWWWRKSRVTAKMSCPGARNKL